MGVLCYIIFRMEMVASHPKIKICLAHFGWSWCREVAMLMLKYPNVYTDTGALYFDSTPEFYLQILAKNVSIT
jgi:predicted TIM-barrel fold metal-dependent hydrolase